MILDAGAIFVSSNFLFQKISLPPSCNKILYSSPKILLLGRSPTLKDISQIQVRPNINPTITIIAVPLIHNKCYVLIIPTARLTFLSRQEEEEYDI